MKDLQGFQSSMPFINAGSSRIACPCHPCSYLVAVRLEPIMTGSLSRQSVLACFNSRFLPCDIIRMWKLRPCSFRE